MNQKNISNPIACWLLATLVLAPVAVRAAGSLDQDFANPPQAARPYVWWHWLSFSVSQAGVDRDIAAMKETGLGGALITNLASLPSIPGQRMGNPPSPEMGYGGKAWWALMKHTLTTGHAAGLDMGMVNCPGWAVSGGPWVTPELSMQRLVSAETKVTGGRYTGAPARAKVNPRWNYYRDVALVAVPDGDEVDVASVIDLSARLQPDGTLDWEVPPGSWTLYRFGHTTVGRMTNPLPDGIEALEVDKLDAKAAEFHVTQLLATLRENLGEVIGKEVRHIHFDSYEAGKADWTANFPAQFQAQHGYDIRPWLPVTAGRRIGGALAARFEWDYRQALSDLFAHEHLATMSRLFKAAGVRMSLEPYTGPFDTVAAAAQAELPMSEFWSRPKSWLNTRMDRHDHITRSVAAAGQGADARIVCAEALTGFPMDSQWIEDPAFLKPAIDWAMVSGINQFQLHSWVQQPFGDEIKPGLTLSWWGTHFGRNQTWFKPGKDFFTYLSRSAAVLQHGAVVSDVCTVGYVGEKGDAASPEVFLKARVEGSRIVLPNGRSYALVALPPDTRAMLPQMAAKVRELVAAGGAILAPKPQVSPSLAGFPAADQKVTALADEVWDKLDGVNRTRREFGRGRIYWGLSLDQALAAEKVAPNFIVETGDPAAILSLHRREGDTDIYYIVHSGTEPISTALSFRTAGKIPEIWTPADGARTDAALWAEREGRTRVLLPLGPAEALFVVFRRPAAKTDPATTITRQAEFSTHDMLGHHYLPDATFAQRSVERAGPAMSGAELVTDQNGHTRLRAALSGRYEVGFRSGKKAVADVESLPKAIEPSGDWSLEFASAVGASPAPVKLAVLQSWSNHSDPGVKYFAGTATYRKEVTVPSTSLKAGTRVILDLGAVRSLAEVSINGRRVGVRWTPPYAFDVTGAVKAGSNQLEIAVTNTWRNRLIGDEQQPSDQDWGASRMFRRTIPVGAPMIRFPDWLIQGKPRPAAERQAFVSWNYFTKESSLDEAGLFGPVMLRFEADVVLEPK
jgi:hypothetical protein